MAPGKVHSPGDRGAGPAGQHRGRLSPWLLSLALVCACGYSFSVGRGRLPDGGVRLAIPLAGNRTVESWCASHFTRALRVEAGRSGLDVVAGDEVPVLESRVDRVRAVPRGVAVYGGRYRTREQEVLVRVELALRRAGKRAWELSLTGKESFLSAPDLRGTEANQRMALRTVLDRLAAQAIERLARGF